MKFKTTQKYIKYLYGNDLFSVGYCGAYHLLYGLNPFAYNSGVYGWNCDYYIIGDICICTGYRPHGRSTIGKTAQYEEQCKKIVNDWNISYDEKIKQIEIIRNEWINKLMEC